MTSGTLRLYGPGELGHLDPACSPGSPTDQITRLCTRQLFTYRPTADLRSWQAVTPVPDIAAEIPSIYNAGVGASYTSYVVHLRPGVLWDTTPPRAVTTQDVVRGLKRMCNPVHGPAALPYFTSTIRGMAEFRDGYASAVSTTGPSAAELAAYQDAHEISGVLVLDDETLVFELIQPALDFINVLALPCAAPAPAEYDAFVPGSPELCGNIRSNGPYRPSHHVPGRELRLVPNPVWRQESDPVRNQNLDAVEVTAERATPDQVTRKISSGEADLPWGPAAAVGPSHPGHELGLALDPYLVLNTYGALGQVKVRQAIAYAIDKAAIAGIVEALGTGATVRTAGSIIPPGNDAHRDHDAYPTPGGRGDPALCRALLAEAGHPNGLTLTAIHPDTEPSPAIARSYAADLTKAGVTVRMTAVDRAAYRALLEEPARAGQGQWDIAVESRTPDWFPGNGRVFLQPMFQTCGSRSGVNYGRYSNPEVDELIARALASAEEPAQANVAWRKAESAVLSDAAIVPLLFQAPATPPHGARVRNAMVLPTLGCSWDLATLRLATP